MNNNISAKYVEPVIYNIKGWLSIVDILSLESVFSEALKVSGFKVLNYSSHKFPLDAYTAFWLLAESHLAIHTFVENNTCYVELSSCNECKTLNFKKFLSHSQGSMKWEHDKIEKCSSII